MIEKIVGENFQNHETIEVELDTEITTICGKSRAGKSALVRLLRWICHNKPSGRSFVRWGEKETRGTVTIDGHEITRSRGEKNEYHLDGQRYVSFGNNVPDDITKVINLDHNNWQLQADPPFWFGLSPTEVSKELNRIVALDLIDETLANAATAIRQEKAKQEVIVQRLTEARQRRDELEWTVEANEMMGKIDKMEERLERKRKKASELRELLSEAVQVEQTLQRAESTAVGVAKGVSLASEYEEIRKTKKLLKKLLSDCVYEEERLCETENQIDQIDRQRNKFVKGRCPTCMRPLLTLHACA